MKPTIKWKVLQSEGSRMTSCNKLLYTYSWPQLISKLSTTGKRNGASQRLTRFSYCILHLLTSKLHTSSYIRTSPYIHLHHYIHHLTYTSHLLYYSTSKITFITLHTSSPLHTSSYIHVTSSSYIYIVQKLLYNYIITITYMTKCQ